MRSITCSGEHEEDNEDFLNEQSIIYYDCYRLHISWGRENQFHWSMGIRGRSHLIIGFTSISRFLSFYKRNVTLFPVFSFFIRLPTVAGVHDSDIINLK